MAKVHTTLLIALAMLAPATILAAPALGAAPFEASFTIVSATPDWTEVDIAANHQTTAVSANADGVAIGGLTHLGGNRWGRAMNIAQGAQVKFTAADAGGAKVVSPTFTWGGSAPPSGTPPPSGPSGGAFDFGSDIAIGSAYSNSVRGNVIDIAKASRMTIIFTDAKDGSGKAGWYTTNYPMSSSAYTPGDGSVERAVRDAHANGFKSAVRFATFTDVNAAAKFPNSRIGDTNYLDPACPEVRAHMIGMLKDLTRRTDVDEINLDYVRYSATLPSWTTFPCTGGTAGQVTDKRNEVIASFVKEANAAIKSVRSDVKLSASVFPQSMKAPLTAYGQDAGRMAPHIDVFMPMIYPGLNFRGQDPYKVTYDLTKAGVDRFGSAKVRPWIQGEGTYAGTVAPVCNQIRAVTAAGGSGALPWWFHTMGFSKSMWQSISDCLPATTTPSPTPTPAPTPAPGTSFEATFEPKPGNEWWVEVFVTTNHASARVTATVDGTETNLDKNTWGSWTKSIHVVPGNTVTFSAYDTSGARKDSPSAYTWPAATPTGSGAPSPTPPFDVKFTPKPGNEWWIEVQLAATRDISRVTARVGGASVTLAPTNWGTWAATHHVKSGELVTFTATAKDGATSTSASYNWLSGSTAPPPSDTLAAKFEKGGANEWWVEVRITAGEPLKRVTADLGGGRIETLDATAWGSWAKSVPVPAGTSIRFTAEGTSGARATSQSYSWP